MGLLRASQTSSSWDPPPKWPAFGGVFRGCDRHSGAKEALKQAQRTLTLVDKDPVTPGLGSERQQDTVTMGMDDNVFQRRRL